MKTHEKKGAEKRTVEKKGADKKSGDKKRKRDEKDWKLHVEVLPINWTRLEEFVEAYNEDPNRVTPPIKPKHVVNLALDRYLSSKKV